MGALRFQPKQVKLLDLVNEGKATWIGVGGGRGGAKSKGLQNTMLARRARLPGTIGAILMRNFAQVQKYHVDPILRDFPELFAHYHKTENKIILPGKPGQPVSEIHFMHADRYEEVVKHFRSANYYDVFVDQAEQFSEEELREIRQAVRHKDTLPGTCKLVLAFNMGGIGIDFLRRIFHFKEYLPQEETSDYAFIHVYPWDNIEWVRPALAADGYTDHTKPSAYQIYYEKFTEQQRMQYCATRADYGKALMSQDEPLRKRDWLGSWESLEGSYFARVFDRQSTVLTDEQVALLVKPWWKRWLSQDWGRGHFCTTLWHARGEISPKEAYEVLNWSIQKPVKVAVTYREYIAGGAAKGDEGGDRELAEQDIAREIVLRTLLGEKDQVRAFFLSPDAFAKRQSANTIAMTESRVLRQAGMTGASPADNDRVGGWSLMYNLLLGAKLRSDEATREAWLISAQCPELINAIPLAMRDPKNLDDVLKTDIGAARIEQDILDSARYGLKTMIQPGHKPEKQILAEQLDAITDPHAKSMAHRAFMARRRSSTAFYVH